ncbi:MAG TPA: ketoacyl-ACP synthase III [Polyangia bacterium]|jgi:3-oxoacyl-[acyl-carrier-protein] synthase-3
MDRVSVNIAGIGTYLPDTVKRNEDFDLAAGGLDAAWLAESGLRERRWAAPEETILDLALGAARRALGHARLSPNEVDLLILVSSTFRPSQLVPTGAVQLQDRLGIHKCLTLFLAETCCGALMALELAAAYLRAGQARNALIVAAETFSKTFNPASGLTFRIGFSMGDGAGAVVLSAGQDAPDGHVASYFDSSASFQSGLGIKPECVVTDGAPGAGLRFGFGGTPPSQDGRFLAPHEALDAIRRFTTTTVPVAVRGALERAGMTGDDVALFILHQPNRKFLEAWRAELAIPQERTLDTLSRFGNLSSVSVLVNLDMAYQTGRLHPGDTVLLASVGEGANWGAMLWRWRVPPDPGRDDLLRARPPTLQQRLVTIENLPLTEIFTKHVLPGTKEAYRHDELFHDFVPAWAVFEGVPLAAAFEYLRSTENMAEWTLSMRRLRRVRDDIFEGEEEATPTGRVFIRTLADERARTIEWRCSHADPDDLWLVHQGQLVEAQAAFGRPGTAFLWMNFVHERARRDPALGAGFRFMFARHRLEIANLKMILEDRFAAR